MSALGARCLLVLLAASWQGGQCGECPSNVLTSASRCFPSHFSNGLISNLTAITQHCQNGVFEQSLACLTDIETSCHDNPDKQQLLHSYMDVGRWKASWAQLCSSVHMLQEQSSCWSSTSQQSAACIKGQMSELQERLLKASVDRVATSRSASDTAVTLTAALDNLRHYCNTSRGILSCFQPTLHKLCSANASRLLEDLFRAFQPPLCDVTGHGVRDDDVTTDDNLAKDVNNTPESLSSRSKSLSKANTKSRPEYKSESITKADSGAAMKSLNSVVQVILLLLISYTHVLTVAL
ncbi:uncharacterized protein [Littorina saxatilis]|uniref:uncharacterized protein n=1 Tax=Littorina saxatilis TaxID=31220 RepID=UPI0038B57E49